MTGRDVTIDELRELDYDDWVRFVTASPDGSVYSLPEYLDVLCRTAGGRFRILAARLGTEIVGGVGLYERRGLLAGYVSHRLLLFYNGLVLPRYDTRYPSQQTSRNVKAMEALAERITARQYGRVTLKSRHTVTDIRPFLKRGWAGSLNYSYVVPLSDIATLWDRVEQNLRRLIKRCGKQQFHVTCDDDFKNFYRLHAQTMDRRDLACYLPEDAFRQYVHTLLQSKLCRLYHARLPDGRTVATQLVLLGPSSTTHTVAAATDPEFLPSGVTAFLRWHVFDDLARGGFEANDLTDASLNPVTHFKSQLGGDLVTNLVLDAPRSLAYTSGELATEWYWRARSIAGRLARYLGIRK